jgi:capsular exopolysaccharide synthesis family protein
MRPLQMESARAGLAAPGTFAAEQYQSLRLKLERLQQSSGVRVLAVTSPGTSEGKTVTSINLAAALARGSNARVLLIDADLRRPAVADHLSLSDGDDRGLADAIADPDRPLSAVVRHVDGSDGLAVVPAGSTPQEVHELLRSPNLDRLLQEARRDYDFVVLDTPPLIPVCDAAVLARVVDGTLVVVAAHETSRRQLGDALSLLDEAKTLGIVFNGDDGVRAGKYDAYYRRH